MRSALPLNRSVFFCLWNSFRTPTTSEKSCSFSSNVRYVLPAEVLFADRGGLSGQLGCLSATFSTARCITSCNRRSCGYSFRWACKSSMGGPAFPPWRWRRRSRNCTSAGRTSGGRLWRSDITYQDTFAAKVSWYVLGLCPWSSVRTPTTSEKPWSFSDVAVPEELRDVTPRA